MKDNILVIGDIHANLSALSAVLNVAKDCNIKKVILLGDIIDYGMRPNETIELIKEMPFKIIANLQGNHEMSYLKEQFSRFSSDRGRESLGQTIKMLNNDSKEFINKTMESSGKKVIEIAGKKILLVHGNLDDEYWGKIELDVDANIYFDYDVVISAHTHKAHYFIKTVKKGNISKSIRFVNCGSVGQPRNGINFAQYLIVDSFFNNFNLCSVEYDILLEQSLYDGRLDDYYRMRLEKGE